jgi:hypothetical protein
MYILNLFYWETLYNLNYIIEIFFIDPGVVSIEQLLDTASEAELLAQNNKSPSFRFYLASPSG